MGSADITLQIDAFRSLYSVQGYKPQLSVHNLKILWHNPQSRLVTYIHIQRAHTHDTHRSGRFQLVSKTNIRNFMRIHIDTSPTRVICL